MAKTRRRKTRTHKPELAEGVVKKGEPKTMVFRRGKSSAVLADLEQDVRRVMLPNTAINLRETRRNVLKDFVSVGGPLGVTHLIMLTTTANSAYLKIAKSPRGPTLSMRLHEYSLIRDVQASLARPRCPTNAFKAPPLVVMNGFSNAEHLRLATTLFQSMFPAINVHKVKLASCQRVVMLQYDKTTGRIRFRHYSVSVAPSGLRKNLKALLQRQQLPDLGNLTDVSEFIMKSGYGSESEGEEAEASRVVLAHDLGKGNVAARQSRVRLHEIGPRMELEVVKVEEGLCEGRVLYHSHVSKTPQQADELQQRVDARERERRERRVQQDSNVRKKQMEASRKAAEAEGERARKAGRLPTDGKKQWWEEELERDSREPSTGAAPGGDDDEDDDDAQYYRDEVGEEPEEGDMLGKRSTSGGGHRPAGRNVRGRGAPRGRSSGRGEGRGRGRSDRGRSSGGSRGGRGGSRGRGSSRGRGGEGSRGRGGRSSGGNKVGRGR